MIASMATLALNSGLWVRRLLIGGSPDQGRCPASEVNDGGCPGKQSNSASSVNKLPSMDKGNSALTGLERRQQAGKSAFDRKLRLRSFSEDFCPLVQPLWAGFQG